MCYGTDKESINITCAKQVLILPYITLYEETGVPFKFRVLYGKSFVSDSVLFWSV